MVSPSINIDKIWSVDNINENSQFASILFEHCGFAPNVANRLLNSAHAQALLERLDTASMAL